METRSYEQIINAPEQTVWDVLWGSETHRQWTQFFSEERIMKSDWKAGGKTYFLNAEGVGIVSTIDSLEPPYQVVFKHLGTVDDEGREDTRSKEIMEWSGFFERYHLIGVGGHTKLHIEAQLDKNLRNTTDEGFVKGLEIIKQLAENAGPVGM